MADLEDRDALRRELGTDVFNRVVALENDYQRWVTGRVVHTIARHLPSVAPAVHALARHAMDDPIEHGCCDLPALR